MRHLRYVALSLLLALSVGCAGNKVPIIVGNSALAVADSIEQLSNAGRQLTDASVIAPMVNLALQKKLLDINDAMKPLPDILRTIDRLQQAEQSTTEATDKAIAILSVVGQDISVTVQGVPLSEATSMMIALIRAAQSTVQTVLVEVAKIKGRE